MANDTTQEAIGLTLHNGLDLDFADEKARTLATANAQDLERINALLRDEWEGRNILEDAKLSAEIAKEPNWIAWAQNRCDMRYYDGLMIKDWVPVTLSDGTNMPYAMGRFDGTFGAGDTEETTGSIDFVPIFAYPTAVQFNTTNTNQGTAAKPNPYCASHLHEWELNTYLPMLPADLRSAIRSRRVLAESRFQSGQTLTDSTSWAWTDLGKIWSLSEMEVYGCIVWGTKNGYSVGFDTQFPIFAQTKDRIRRSAADGATRLSWWLRTVGGSSSTWVCAVHALGLADCADAASTNVRPLPCFRL